MSNDKQTAVEWLLDRIEDVDLTEKLWENVKQQAKEMEKEQIEEAYKYARAHWSREDGNAERYYNETYGGNK
jgi:spore coat polysaccharide biosynthesis protein SpsF (cytidylyltransferase family)